MLFRNPLWNILSKTKLLVSWQVFGRAEIVSNHWKTGGKFFQSLEKPGGIFQPLETFFPIIGKNRFAAGGVRRAFTGGRGAGITPA
ncbi:MAG: hypothetical protein IKO01_00510 [Kiritimatiellae bacterium]|nr:hypothetical protein [Kiritimatiellia bacterium]